jgi:serine/threonine protein kinase
MKTEFQRIGQYELQQRLGQENAGETWRAYDTSARQTVILKLYRPDLLDVADVLTDYLDRVQQIASLHHPNITRIYDIQLPGQTNQAASLLCFAVEYVEGGTLADYIKQTATTGKVPPSAEIVQLFSALALALDYAHQRGLVHGNLKPSNILLNQSAGESSYQAIPRITDFAQTRFNPKKQNSDIPFYLAPEQVKGAAATRSSDIYALGVLLYELYTGQAPFRGNRPIAVMMQHVNAQPTPPDLVNPAISPALAQVILRCLAKDPRQRFPSVTALVLALADALHVPVAANLRHFALAQGSVLADDNAAPISSGDVKDVDLSAPPGLNSPEARLRAQRRRQTRSLVIIALVTLLFVLGASSGAMFFMRRSASTSPGAGQMPGHAFFLNSGQLNTSTTQGINDELQIDISNLPDLSPGKNYYAWLLGDLSQTESTPLLLGRLNPVHGSVHFLYPGTNQHTNLLTFASRFLLTEDSTSSPSSNPLLDQSTWRYYALIPQTPDPTDKLHFSMLDHLRHLLVESPELAIRGLHGGLAFWFARDAAATATATDDLARAWQRKDATTLRHQIVRVLDYLDGTTYIKPDVPTGTAFLADAQMAQIALLGPAPHDAYAPGYVYQDEPPPGYVYLLQAHLNGALLSPQTTANQRQLAVQINSGIDSARRALSRVYQDARQLIVMTDAQLLQSPALALLNDMSTQAQYASTGQPDPATGSTQGGALWIYNNLQHLATFEIAPYVAKKA